jgi:selenocysteine lyase/cysteine desulfurase
MDCGPPLSSSTRQESEIAPAVLDRANQIAEGAARKGYEVMGSRTPAATSGIVTIRKEGLDSRLVVSRLRNARIIAAPRQGWIRTSPHFYVSPESIERMLDLLP